MNKNKMSFFKRSQFQVMMQNRAGGLLRFCLVIFLMLSTFPLHAASQTSGNNFLKVDVGARAVSMGGVQYGADNDSFAPFYNPALFAYNSQREAGFMHNQYFEGITQEVFTYLYPSQNLGNFAGSLNYFSYGKIEGFNTAGVSSGQVSSYDMTATFSWARAKNVQFRNWKIQNLSWGTSLKLINRKLVDESAFGAALDFGVSLPMRSGYLKGSKVAFAVQNLGTQVQNSPLPRTVRFGVVRPFLGGALVPAADVIYSADDGLYPALGVEYKLLKIASLRLGYKGLKGLEKKLSYGIGFSNPLFRLDYAFVAFGDLGNSHRISFNYFFGKVRGQRTQIEEYLQQKLDQSKTLYAQGLLIDAYILVTEINRVAPWLNENNELLNNIKRDFKRLEDSEYKERLLLQIKSILTRGEKYYEQGNLINARTDFLAVLGIDPENRAAEGYLKQIDAQFASFVDSFYRNGMIAFAAEDYEKAKEEFEKVLTINANHVDAKLQLERCIKILDQREQQVADAVKQDTLEKTWQEAVKTYKDGKLEESIRLFRAVLDIKPEDKEAKAYVSEIQGVLFKQYSVRGKSSMEKGDLEAAIRNFKSALSYGSSNDISRLLKDAQAQWSVQKKVLSQNLYRTGLEAFLAGNKDKAREIWNKAVAMDPDNEEAKRGLSRLETTK